jgi:hypothetical protein
MPTWHAPPGHHRKEVAHMGLFGPDVASDLARIEWKLDLIMRHLDINPHADIPDEVAQLAHAGKKIAAIKEYRRVTGVGLRDAKEYVESLAVNGHHDVP